MFWCNLQSSDCPFSRRTYFDIKATNKTNHTWANLFLPDELHELGCLSVVFCIDGVPPHCVSSLSVTHKDAGWCFQKLSQKFSFFVRSLFIQYILCLSNLRKTWRGQVTGFKPGSSERTAVYSALRGAPGGAICWGTALQADKVAGSIPDGVIGIFRRHNSSGSTVALGLNKPVTEMSTRNISWVVKAAGA